MSSDKEKEEYIKGIEKKYKGRRGFGFLFKKAQRETYKDDILQPYQPKFKQRWYKAWKDRQLMYDAVDRKVARDEQEIENIYRRNKIKGNVVTLEKKILKDIHLEHPTMMSESDIIKHDG